MTKARVTIWTNERIEKLKELWPTHSATQCAKQIFPDATRKKLSAGGRNAVIGKAHRLGLPAKAPRGPRRHEVTSRKTHPADRRALGKPSAPRRVAR